MHQYRHVLSRMRLGNASGYYLLRICALDENTTWIAGTAQNIPFNGIFQHTTDSGQTWNEQHYIKCVLDFPGKNANLRLALLNIFRGCAMLDLCT